jgi:hypothetical protein
MPMKIYLDEPLQDSSGHVVKIDGLPLGYTLPGAYYLLNHYEQMLAKATPQQMAEKDRTHLITTIERIKNCIAYYENLSPAQAN